MATAPNNPANRQMSLMAFTVVIATAISLASAADNRSPDAPVPPHPTTKPTKDELAGIDFTLTARKTEYEEGQPIIVDAILRNLRDQPVIVLERRGVPDERNCLVMVRRKDDNKTPPLTEFGTAMIEAQSRGEHLRLRSTTLLKNESMTTALEVSKVYDLSKPGRYSVYTFRYVYRSDGKYVIPVTTNVVNIAVVER